MELQKAVIKDVLELKNVCEQAYSLNFHNHWNTGGLDWYLNKEFSIARLQSDLNNKNVGYYIIKHEEQNVGFLKLIIDAEMKISVKNAMEIEKIYLLPKCKGQGLGKLVIKEVIKIAIKHSKDYLILNVIDTNTSSIAFYKKQGFKFHKKTILDVPFFKEELKGMDIMLKTL